MRHVLSVVYSRWPDFVVLRRGDLIWFSPWATASSGTWAELRIRDTHSALPRKAIGHGYT